jgi:hypothetical protein
VAQRVAIITELTEDVVDDTIATGFVGAAVTTAAIQVVAIAIVTKLVELESAVSTNRLHARASVTATGAAGIDALGARAQAFTGGKLRRGYATSIGDVAHGAGWAKQVGRALERLGPDAAEPYAKGTADDP